MGFSAPGSLSRSRVVQRVAVRCGKIVSLAWSRYGTYLACGCNSGDVFIFEVIPGGGGVLNPKLVQKLTGHVGDILSMAWSAKDFLATGSTDHSVRLWHPKTEQCLRRFVHPDMVTIVTFHPTDDNLLVTGGCDGVVRLWRPAAHAVVAESVPGSAISAARFSVDGDVLHIGRYNGTLAQHDVRDVLAHSHHADKLEAVLEEARHTVLHHHAQQTPLLAETVNRCAAPPRRRRAGGAKVCAIAQSSGDIVAVTADGRAHVFGPGNTQIVVRLKTGRNCMGSDVLRSLTADGRFLVGDADGGQVHVVDFACSRANAGALRRRIRDPSLPLESVVVMKNGNVSAAEFASEQVVEYLLGEACVKGAMVLAVGSDDGVLHIVANVLKDRT